MLASLVRSCPRCATMFLQYLWAWICPGFHDFILTSQLMSEGLSRGLWEKNVCSVTLKSPSSQIVGHSAYQFDCSFFGSDNMDMGITVTHVNRYLFVCNMLSFHQMLLNHTHSGFKCKNGNSDSYLNGKTRWFTSSTDRFIHLCSTAEVQWCRTPLSVTGPLVYTLRVAGVLEYKPQYYSMYIWMTIVIKHGRNYGG